MPGSTSNPVKLDYFQNIIEVGWRTVEYVVISTGLKNSLGESLERPPLNDFGEFSDAGVPTSGGVSYYPAYYEYLTRSFADSFATLNYQFTAACNSQGVSVGGITGDPLTVVGAPTLPLNFAMAEYVGPDAVIWGPELLAQPQHDWAPVGASLAVPVPGAWFSGAAISRVTGHVFTDAANSFNENYPTPPPGAPYRKSRPAAATRSTASDLNFSPSSVSVTGIAAATFAPIGVRLTKSVITGILSAAILCQRQ